MDYEHRGTQCHQEGQGATRRGGRWSEGFWSLWGCLFPTFPLISQVPMQDLPVYFISSGALVWNRGTAPDPSPAPSRTPTQPSGGGGGAARLSLSCPCPVPPQWHSPRGAPILPRCGSHHVSSVLHTEEGTAGTLQGQLPAAASLPACLLGHGEKHTAPCISLSQKH